MSDPGKESGFKWWLRYVIVPLIGGGGLIGIFISFREHPPVSAPAAVSSPQPTSSVTPRESVTRPAGSRKAEFAPAVTPSAGLQKASDKTEPAAVAPPQLESGSGPRASNKPLTIEYAYTGESPQWLYFTIGNQTTRLLFAEVKDPEEKVTLYWSVHSLWSTGGLFLVREDKQTGRKEKMHVPRTGSKSFPVGRDDASYMLYDRDGEAEVFGMSPVEVKWFSK
jgi:hypothetical protein